MTKELCICDELSTGDQTIRIFNDRRKWGKVVTIMSFQGKTEVNLNEILKKAKKKVASGGTIRGNEIELRGEHRFKLKKFLIDQGFSEENIMIS